MREVPATTEAPSRLAAWLDGVIMTLAPAWGARRKAWREISRFSRIGYRGARATRIGAPAASPGSADLHLERDYDRRDLVDRSRQVERDNQIACGLLDRSTENVVGCGIMPKARSADPEWNRKANALWKEWAKPGPEGADVRGQMSFYELQALVYRSLKRDGDVGTILLRNGQLQCIESDQISAPLGREQQPSHIDGVDVGPRGQLERFYIVQDQETQHLDTNRRDRAPREVVEAKDFIFLANRARLGQTRGLPVFAQSLELFEQEKRLREAVIAAARMAACFGLIIKTKSPVGGGLPRETGSDGVSRRKWTMEPAMVKRLRDTEDIEQIKPQQPTQNFDAFFTTMVRLLGLQLGLPLELVLMDFSRTNYSSARASLLQAYRAFQKAQKFMIEHWCERIWKWKIQAWVEDGLLEARDDMLEHSWTPPGWAWVDPVTEIEANLMGVDAGITTLQRVAASQGQDLLELLDEREEELREFERRGLPVVRSNRTRDPYGEAAEPEKEPEDERRSRRSAA